MNAAAPATMPKNRIEIRWTESSMTVCRRSPRI
jgi:hypothetical protein